MIFKIVKHRDCDDKLYQNLESVHWTSGRCNAPGSGHWENIGHVKFTSTISWNPWKLWCTKYHSISINTLYSCFTIVLYWGIGYRSSDPNSKILLFHKKIVGILIYKLARSALLKFVFIILKYFRISYLHEFQSLVYAHIFLNLI